MASYAQVLVEAGPYAACCFHPLLPTALSPAHRGIGLGILSRARAGVLDPFPLLVITNGVSLLQTIQHSQNY